MLGRNIEDEMARITERGSQHAAAAWLRIANHAEQPEQQLKAHQQAGVLHDALIASDKNTKWLYILLACVLNIIILPAVLHILPCKLHLWHVIALPRITWLLRPDVKQSFYKACNQLASTLSCNQRDPAQYAFQLPQPAFQVLTPALSPAQPAFLLNAICLLSRYPACQDTEFAY